MTARKPMGAEAWKRWKRREVELERLASWESQSAELEEVARAHLPESGVKAERGSDAWIAERITWGLRSAGDLIERGDARWAAVEALGVGSLAGAWGPARAWRRSVEEQAARRRKGGASAGSLRKREKQLRHEAIREIAAGIGIDLTTFQDLSRPDQRAIVTFLESALWDLDGVPGVSQRTIRADIRALSDV